MQKTHIEQSHIENSKTHIEKQYGLSTNEIQKLITGNTLESLENFKHELNLLHNENTKKLSEKQSILLFKSLQKIQL